MKETWSLLPQFNKLHLFGWCFSITTAILAAVLHVLHHSVNSTDSSVIAAVTAVISARTFFGCVWLRLVAMVLNWPPARMSNYTSFEEKISDTKPVNCIINHLWSALCTLLPFSMVYYFFPHMFLWTSIVFGLLVSIMCSVKPNLTTWQMYQWYQHHSDQFRLIDLKTP